MIKVLIIEDEPLIADLYAKTLGKEEFDVEIATDGNEGLELAKTKAPDIILLDIMMPEPNGIQVLQALKSDDVTKSIPVVMLTNLSGKNDSSHAFSVGAMEYWVKNDIKSNELGSRVKQVLNKMKEKDESATINTKKANDDGN